MSPLTRRTLIGRGLVGAGAIALPGSLAAAATAQAQQGETTDQTEALERLILLEQAAELAFSIAADEGDVDKDANTLFDELSIHAGDHADAFSEAMDQLLIDPPERDSDPEAYESLKDFDPDADQDGLVAFLIDLELGLLEAYDTDEPELDEPDLVRTAAQVAASHAQALVALRLLAGETTGLTKLPSPSSSATDSEDTDSDS